MEHARFILNVYLAKLSGLRSFSVTALACLAIVARERPRTLKPIQIAAVLQVSEMSARQTMHRLWRDGFLDEHMQLTPAGEQVVGLAAVPEAQITIQASRDELREQALARAQGRIDEAKAARDARERQDNGHDAKDVVLE